MRLHFGRDETCLGQVALYNRSRALRIGWGFDEDLPLRPWPAMHRDIRLIARRPAVDTCIAWAGFYIGWTTIED